MTTLKDNLGMGIYKFSIESYTGYVHGGTIEGFRAVSMYFSGENLTIAITSNALEYNINVLVEDVLIVYFNLQNFEAIEITAEELDKYIGTYEGQNIPGDFLLTQENIILCAQLNDSPKAPLTYKGRFRFVGNEV